MTRTRPLDLDDIDYVYRIALGRGLNADERYAAQIAMDTQPDAFAPELFRKGLLSSQEFLLRNREELLFNLFRRPCIVGARTPMGQEIFVDIRQLYLGFAIAAGEFEPLETAFVAANVKAGMQVCDIGANAGYFSLICAGLVGNSGTVFAFEPVRETYARLTAAIVRNGLGHIIRPYNLALADRAGSLQIAYERDGANIGGAHLVGDDGRASAPVQEWVEVKTLDEVVGRGPVDFVKMDVEGAEGLVLEGGRQTIGGQLPTLLIEFNLPQLAEVSRLDAPTLARRLEEMGYELHEIIEGGRTERFADTAADVARLAERTGIFNCVARRRS